MKTPNVNRQITILTARYLDVMLGDITTLLLLIAQGPIIAILCVLVWSGVESDTTSLHFVLALAAVWFGCINSCREIVKERSLFERERLFGLSPLAYVISKAKVLMGIGLIQVSFLLGIIEWKIGISGNIVWHFIALILVVTSGTGLGLAISAFSKRQERAVAAVPLLILPQILISDFVIPREAFGKFTDIGEEFMIVRWGYRIFKEAAAAEPSYQWMLISIGVLILMTVFLHILASLSLSFSDGERFL